MPTMKAIRIHEFGGLNSLKYEDVPRPVPGPDEVLIRIHAAGVNPVDWQLTFGINQDFLKRTLPTILGFDVCGEVVETGFEVAGFSAGDAVYGHTDFRYDGSFAQYMVSTTGRLSPKPINLDYTEAAAVPVGALAAWAGLFGADAINLQKGQTVLIHGAAGGVGTFAVQFAKWCGGRVIATGSQHNRDFLLQLGADQFIDYNTQCFDEIVDPVDGVLDSIGGDTQLRSIKILRYGGVLASLVGEQWGQSEDRPDIRKMNVHGGYIPEKLREITPLLESGIVRPIISHVMPLSEARKALELSKTGHARGKIVLNVL